MMLQAFGVDMGSYLLEMMKDVFLIDAVHRYGKPVMAPKKF